MQTAIPCFLMRGDSSKGLYFRKEDLPPNCGNIPAGVAPFALENGLVEARDGVTPARVPMLNSDNLCELLVETPVPAAVWDGRR